MNKKQTNKNDVKLDPDFDLENDFEIPTYSHWKNLVKHELNGKNFDDHLITDSYEGIKIQPLYTKSDIEKIQYLDNMPGFENYLRGNSAGGNVTNGWEIKQLLKTTNLEEFNKQLRKALKNGQNSITIPIDLSILIDENFKIEKSHQSEYNGLFISSIDSFEKLFEKIEIKNYPVYIEANYSPLPIFSLFASYMNKHKISISDIQGGITADFIGYLSVKGTLPHSINSCFNNLKHLTLWLHKNNSKMKSIAVSGIQYNSAGATAVQELTFTLATAVEYLNELIDRGLSPQISAEKMMFSFGIGPFYFMEIAKLRAARILWSQIASEYGISGLGKQIFTIAKTSVYNQTVYDPYVNMLRTATETFSAIVAGANGIQTNPFNETLGMPDNFSTHLARNTQLILKEEAHLNKIIDPAGGSFYVEKLTEEVAEKAWTLVQKIEKNGGMLKSLKSGIPQKMIEETAKRRNKNLEHRKDILIGINKYANPTEEKLPGKPFDVKKSIDISIKEFKNFRENINKQLLLDKIKNLRNSINKNNGIINKAIDAASAGASLTELVKCFHNKNSDEKIIPIKIYRIAEKFELLRQLSEGIEKIRGFKPKALLLTIGALKNYKARAEFSREFFEAGGFEVVKSGESFSMEKFNFPQNPPPDISIICSNNSNYEKITPSSIELIKTNCFLNYVIFAGKPIKLDKQNSAIHFIYNGVNMFDVLLKLLKNIKNKL